MSGGVHDLDSSLNSSFILVWSRSDVVSEHDVGSVSIWRIAVVGHL